MLLAAELKLWSLNLLRLPFQPCRSHVEEPPIESLRREVQLLGKQKLSLIQRILVTVRMRRSRRGRWQTGKAAHSVMIDSRVQLLMSSSFPFFYAGTRGCDTFENSWAVRGTPTLGMPSNIDQTESCKPSFWMEFRDWSRLNGDCRMKAMAALR